MSSSPDHEDGYKSQLDNEFLSQFTFRDLRSLARFSTICPLRVIALIDFDAFYAQCETIRLGLPESQPLAVQQWNAVIALNYPAKAAGLRRIVTPEEARLKCPEIVLQHVPTWREGDSTWAYRSDVKQHMKTDKAALDPYRQQSRNAFNLIKRLLPAAPLQKVEKASVDEVFLDLSAHVHSLLLARYPDVLGDATTASIDAHAKLPLPPTTHVDWQTDKLVGTSTETEAILPDWDDIALHIASEIVKSVRTEVYNQLRFTCSAGLAHNKSLAKLAAGHNKPNQQTIVRTRAALDLLKAYKLTKIRGLGGKLGRKVVDAFNTEDVIDLHEISLEAMNLKLGSESGKWVHNVIRGIEHSAVVERTQLQSMLAAKTFIPKAKGIEQAEKWLRIFAGDLIGRLEEQDAASLHRRPKVVTVHHSIEGRFGPTRSKQMQIPPGVQITAQVLFNLFRDLLVQISREGPTWPCLGLSVSVSNFEDTTADNKPLTSYFTIKSEIDLEQHRNIRHPLIEQGLQSNAAKRKRALQDFAGFERVSALKRNCGPTVKMELLPMNGSSPTIGRELGEEDDEYSISEVEDQFYLCPKCDERIEHANVLEHLDWHFAVELQSS